MTKKLTEEEYEGLRKYEARCYDMMYNASISVRLLTILLDNYRANQTEEEAE